MLNSSHFCFIFVICVTEKLTLRFLAYFAFFLITNQCYVVCLIHMHQNWRQ